MAPMKNTKPEEYIEIVKPFAEFIGEQVKKWQKTKSLATAYYVCDMLGMYIELELKDKDNHGKSA